MSSKELLKKRAAKEGLTHQERALCEIAAQLAELNDHLKLLTSPGNELAVRVYPAGKR